MDADSEDISELVAALTLEEKIQLVHGAVDPEGVSTGYVPGVERLGIPELRLSDGPLGVRVFGHPATAFPASIALAATFDTDLATENGVALGQEAKALDQDALLGPGVNLIRVPHCGRNFEYYSEDPVVTASFARAVVEGIQSEDVISTPKHFVANNQESNRAEVSAEVSERALRECYLPGFKAAVEAGCGSVMTAYNRVNGTHMSDHHSLLTDVLKTEWGFEGYTVSDWFGVTSTVGAANAGLDLEMPGISREALWSAWDIDTEDAGVFGESEEIRDGMPDPSNTERFSEPLLEAVRGGEVPEARIDDMVTRILGQMKRIGLFDESRDGGDVGSQAHQELAQTIATRGTVMLENDGTLPLADDTDIAVIGPGIREAKKGGGGSSEMEAVEEVSTVSGIEARADGEVLSAQGASEIEQYSFFDSPEEDDATDSDPADATLDAAVDVAENAEVSIVVVNDAATEGKDRETLGLPGDQDELVASVATASDKTVVVVQSSGPVEMPWTSDVDAIVETWYPGQTDGSALASVLYGDVDASGRLPVTFGRESEYPTAERTAYPGVDDEADYDEGIFVGYRHFDNEGVDPQYPFGHGLSYASFEYHSLHAVDESTIEVTVENTSNRDGREVIQAYVRPPAETPVDRPLRELAAFESVELVAGETRTIELTLSELALQRYDESDGWTLEDGEYTVEVGRSSRDTRLETGLKLEQNIPASE